MIYFLEDDNNIRNFVIYALNNTGLSATGFGTPSEFWEAMKTENRSCFFWISCFRKKTGSPF